MKKRRHEMQHARGFTLIEILVTVVIVGILATIALPSYNDYVIRARFAEAMGNLGDLRVKMEQYYADNRSYSNDLAGTICGIPGNNTPTVADGRYFTYACAPTNPFGPGAQQYVLTATGVAAQGLAGLSFTVNQANAKQTVVAAGSDMEKRGYTAGATNCWVRKKPNEC
jgi:type IV pilus assembly protein PilE